MNCVRINECQAVGRPTPLEIHIVKRLFWQHLATLQLLTSNNPKDASERQPLMECGVI